MRIGIGVRNGFKRRVEPKQPQHRNANTNRGARLALLQRGQRVAIDPGFGSEVSG